MLPESQITLIDMNDDCLDAIFKYLTLKELMSVYGETHVLIDEAVKRQFHRFRHFECTMREPPKYGEHKLQLLGRYLHSIFINVGYSIQARDALAILKPLCRGAKESGRLRALKLQHVTWTSEYVDVILLVANSLRLLDVSRCAFSVTQLMSVLNSAPKLHTLKMVSILKTTDEEFSEEELLQQVRCLIVINQPLLPPSHPPSILSQLAEKHKVSIIFYTFPHCDSFTTYGPSLIMRPMAMWHYEYFKDEL
ncbi:uncharacterized protein LOC115626104 [Scaptodrosophila lebanonensis]|uniref:Uncharacterized protein LOC115626104 n=1 Tax=Drosophila lebanonensis TaxID=7225 RepID=A0A6J2TQJ0_DROLE|nr:uncharacterized protein LOC115626104 [Scaptodrosophila lebanonensis]